MHIRVEVWPKAKFAALGAFIFLRYVAPSSRMLDA